MLRLCAFYFTFVTSVTTSLVYVHAKVTESDEIERATLQLPADPFEMRRISGSEVVFSAAFENAELERTYITGIMWNFRVHRGCLSTPRGPRHPTSRIFKNIQGLCLVPFKIRSKSASHAYKYYSSVSPIGNDVTVLGHSQCAHRRTLSFFLPLFFWINHLLSDPRLTSIPFQTIEGPGRKKSMKIILVGETGTGKTAFMSLLYNVLNQRAPDDFIPYHIGENEKGGSGIDSQTRDPVIYTICSPSGFQLTVLDTPGFNDTRGIAKDKVHEQNIVNKIKELNTIDGVFVVSNGTVARLGTGIEYTLSIISKIFPRSIVENFAILYTCTTRPNAKPEALPEALRKSPKWAIDNPFAHHAKYVEDALSLPDWDREDQIEYLARAYGRAIKIIDSMFAWLDNRRIQPTDDIEKLAKLSATIASRISNLLAQVDQQEQKRTKFMQLQEDLKQSKTVRHFLLPFSPVGSNLPFLFNQSEDVFKNYASIKSTSTWVQKNSTWNNQICIVPGCYSNCCTNCDAILLARGTCAAFELWSGECKRCRHESQEHGRFHMMWEEEKSTEEVIDVDRKWKYLDAKDKTAQLDRLSEDVKRDIEELVKKIDQDQQSIAKHCSEYQQLALSGSFGGQISTVIIMLEKRLETMRSSGASTDALKSMEGNVASMKKMLEGLGRGGKSTFTKLVVF